MHHRHAIALTVGLTACGGDKDNSDLDDRTTDDTPAVEQAVDADGDGVPEADDCDDQDATVGAAEPERCNGWDDDCNGLTDAEDPGLTDGVERWVDADGDGWGSTETTVMCPGDPGNTSWEGDCDDTNINVYPDAREQCFNGVDDNCDGLPNDCTPQGRWTLGEGAVVEGPLGDTMSQGDLDGTGDVDVLVRDGEGLVHRWGAAGAEAWGGDQAEALAALTGAMAIGGLDDDAYADLILADPEAQQVYRFSGPLTALPALDTATVLTGSQGLALVVADLGADGGPVLLTGSPQDGGTDGIHGPGAIDACPPEAADLDGCWRVAAGDGATDELGGIVLVADLTGDGISDLVLGAPRADNRTGAAWLLAGPITGLRDLEDADAVVRGEGLRDGLGAAVAAPDMDGDGARELLVGVPGDRSSGEGAGAVFRFAAPTGTLRTPEATSTHTGERGRDAAGASLAVVPDISGTGQDGLLVGGPGADENTGLVWLLVGSGDGTTRLSEAPARWEGGVSDARAGAAVAGADVDRDGLGDMVLLVPGQGLFQVSGAVSW